MDSLDNPIPDIQTTKHNEGLFFCYHALEKMFSRRITVEQVEQALDCSEVEILENYPPIGLPSSHYLIMGVETDGKCLHIVAAYPVIEITTVYEPKPPKWITPRERRKI